MVLASVCCGSPRSLRSAAWRMARAPWKVLTERRLMTRLSSWGSGHGKRLIVGLFQMLLLMKPGWQPWTMTWRYESDLDSRRCSSTVPVRKREQSARERRSPRRHLQLTHLKTELGVAVPVDTVQAARGALLIVEVGEVEGSAKVEDGGCLTAEAVSYGIIEPLRPRILTLTILGAGAFFIDGRT